MNDGDSTTRLSRYVRARRLELGLTLRDVEARSGISPGQLSYIENGKIEFPKVPQLERLAAALEMPTSYLVNLQMRQIEELPSLQFYLRTKFELEPDQIADVAHYLSRYGPGHGPLAGEDELPR